MNTKNSSHILIFIGALVVIVLLLGTIFAFRSGQFSGKSPYSQSLPSPSQKSYNANPSDASDAQMDQDGQNIDNSLNNLDQDVAGVDQAMSDQAVDLSQ